jgi:flagellar motility protein MotE (MotC chaperone)
MSHRIAAALAVATLSAAALLGVAGASAAEAKKAADAQPARRDPQTDAQRYCDNVGAAAADARLAWQTKQLRDLEGQIKQRIADLAAKQADYQKWVEHREALLKKAEDSLVGIYSHMRPEAAAAQISAMDDETAAAVLTELNARTASAILNEMDAARAARLANALAGNAPADGKKS